MNGSKTTKKQPNPCIKGGFQDNPQNINRKGAPKKNSQFCDQFLKKMSGEKLINYLIKHIEGGSEKAVFYTIDRVYGKIKEQIDVEVPAGIEITIKGERKD
jgi:hypothetical protein